jgi:hypothetical protein
MGANGSFPGGYGGGIGANAVTGSYMASGGAGGKAVSRNGYTPTWIAAGTIYGADS